MILVDTSVLIDFFKGLDNEGVSCRKKGLTIRSTIDCLIAQIAIEHDLLLLQNDKDFVHMASIVELKLFK